MKRLGWLVSLVLVVGASFALTLYFAVEEESAYQTGTLTKGNPDNSYLDSCEVYCCGD